MTFAHAATDWVRYSFRHPWRILLITALLAGIAAPVALQLRIDTDLKKLLPESYPRVRAMDTVTSKVGDTGYFSIVVEHDDTATSIRFIKAMADRLADSEFVRSIYYENPVDFMRKYRFLLLPLETLQEIRNYLEKQKQEYNPFFLDLDAEGATTDDTLDMESVKSRYNDIEHMERYHISDDGRIVAMQVRPRKAFTNLSFVKQMHDFLQQEAEALKTEAFPKDMNIYVGGSLKNKIDEYSMIIADISSSAWISALMILCVLFWYFRNVLAIGVLVFPLAAGLSWTFAITTLSIGYLNTITAMLFVVLFGLGIDHGIHLLKRYLQEIENGQGSQHAMEIALSRTGRATVVSALTTAFGFLLMLVTDFKGFSHLGFISGIAMVLILLAYFALLPCLVALTDRTGLLARRPSFGVEKRFWERFSHWIMRLPRRSGVIVGILLLVLGIVCASQIEFNYNFDTLKGTVAESEHIKLKQGKVYTKSLTPGAVAIAHNDAHLDAAIIALKERKRIDTQSPTLDRVVSIRNVFPGDQEARQVEINAAAKQITPLLLEETEDQEIKKILMHLRDNADVGMIAYDEIPIQIREYFRPQDGSADRMIFIFPSVEIRDGRNAIAFADDMYPIHIGNESIIPTSGSLIFADMIRVVVSQGLWLFALSIIAIAVMLRLQYGTVSHMLSTIYALFLGLSLMAVLLHVGSVDVNFYNMAIFAAVVGMGIDAAIHLYSRWLAERDIRKCLVELGGPITASMLTTIAGYTGMIASDHPGLHSIGLLAVIGLGSCFLAAMTLFAMYLRHAEEVQHPIMGAVAPSSPQQSDAVDC